MPYRLIEQHSGNCRVHASAKTEDHFVVSQPLFEGCDGCLDERCRGPVAFAAADPESEIGEDPAAFRRMEDFWMELDSISLLAVDLVGRVGDGFGGRDHPPSIWQG